MIGKEILNASPETIILVINLVIISFAYTVLFPATVKKNWRKLMRYDAVLSAIAISIAGMLYWNTGTSFRLASFSINWFWFSLASYLLMELIPSALYIKKHQIDFTE